MNKIASDKKKKEFLTQLNWVQQKFNLLKLITYDEIRCNTMQLIISRISTVCKGMNPVIILKHIHVLGLCVHACVRCVWVCSTSIRRWVSGWYKFPKKGTQSCSEVIKLQWAQSKINLANKGFSKTMMLHTEVYVSFSQRQVSWHTVALSYGFRDQYMNTAYREYD